MKQQRKLLVFLGVLFLLFVLRSALGQGEENVVGWDPIAYEDPAESIFNIMMAAPILGAMIGAARLIAQRFQRPVVQPIHLR